MNYLALIKNTIIHIYRIIFPKWIRNARNIYLDKKKLERLKNRIIKYYENKHSNITSPEIDSVISYLKSNPISCYPYHWQKKYLADEIEVYKDIQNGLSYTNFKGHKLYFKKSWSPDIIKSYYNDLLIEQDVNSPHRYLTKEFQVEIGENVVDIGAAEGIFSLDVIEKADSLYLFETDEEWIEALNATFLPWRDKVVIVNKYVTDSDCANKITLSNYFSYRRSIDFLKIDVDGAETDLLNGAKPLLTNSKVTKIAICTYHKKNDEQLFTSILSCFGFSISHSNGYMIFYHDKFLDAPYLRRGLIRATKS